jgi:hypothetical protein
MTRSSPRPTLRRIVLILMGVSALAGTLQDAAAAVIYVNSLTGNNRLNGRAPEPINASDGPVRTLQRALQLVRRGDTVSLVNNGSPYYGCFTLVGERVSGTPDTPFRIMGNGAVLSGSKPILPETWTIVGVDLWRITPFRKGHALLLRAETPVPEIPCPDDAETMPELPDGTWCLFQGAVYYKSPSLENPPDLPFSLADDEVGLTLLDVHHVEIHDLVVRHYRLDGINVHDRCHDITLSNVVCEQNGRAGVTVAGSSTATLIDAVIRDNRESSVLMAELGEATILGGEISPEPTRPMAEPIE